MILGVIAGQDSSSLVLQEILMDFVAGTYTVDGVPVDVSDLLGGGFNPATIGSNGMSVGYEDTPIMYCTAIGALFNAIQTGVILGCTIVAEWQKKANPPFASDNYGTIFYAFFGEDIEVADKVSVVCGEFTGVQVYDDVDVNAQAAANFNSGNASVQRVAATISRDTGSGREYAVSANGQAATTDIVGYVQGVSVKTVRLFGAEEFFESVDEWFIRKLQVLPPVIPAALAALSEVEAYPAGDPETGGSLSLLSHFDGADGATSAIDESSNAHTITFLGNAQLDTAQAKFGASSLLLDGTGDAVSIANHASLLFGDGPFTLDIFFRMAAETEFALMGVFEDPSNLSWEIYQYFNFPDPGDNYLVFEYSIDGATGGGPGAVSVIGTGAWHHWMVTRNAQGMLRIGCNGTIIYNAYYGGAFFASAAALMIGARADLSAPFNGWIDEVRIWKGADLYNRSTTYTVPTAQFADN